MRGGLDLVKDDKTLTDQSFCPLIPRLEAVMSALDRVVKETGKKAFYAVNVTAGADQILERAEMAVDHKANMVGVDVLAAGFSSFGTWLRTRTFPFMCTAPCKVPLPGTRATAPPCW